MATSVATEQGLKNLQGSGLIDCRPNGLFPLGDTFLTQLSNSKNVHPFEKHLAGLQSPYELLKKGSWVSGNSAAESGFDLRLFYKASIQPKIYILSAHQYLDEALLTYVVIAPIS